MKKINALQSVQRTSPLRPNRVFSVVLTLLVAQLSACGGQKSAEHTSYGAAPTYTAAPVQNGSVLTVPDLRRNYSLIKTPNGLLLKNELSTGTGAGSTTSVGSATTIQFSDMHVNLLLGDKFKTIPEASLNSLIELYIAFFNRVPDADGMSYWIDQIKAGTTTLQLANSFYSAALQYSAITGYSAQMTNAEFITTIYKNVLGRSDVDTGGMTYWSGALASGSETRGSLINTIVNAAHGFKGDATYGWVADLLDNKVSVGRFFSIDQGLNYNSAEESISKGMAIAGAITPTDTEGALMVLGFNDRQFNLRSSIPGMNSVTKQAVAVLPDALILPPSLPGVNIVAPLNLAAAAADRNFKIWIYDPRTPSVKLPSDGIFLSKVGGNFNFYPASADGTLSLHLGVGEYDFDVLEPNGTSSLFTRARYHAVVPSSGVKTTPSAELPVVPNNLSAAPAGTTLKLWVYDPRNPKLAIKTSIFTVSDAGGSWTQTIGASDGSINVKLPAGNYTMDVAETDPNVFLRRRYTFTISDSGVASINGIAPNAQGIFAVTLDLLDQPGNAVVKWAPSNSNGVAAVTVDLISVVAAPAQKRRDDLIAMANQSALNFVPSSACQLKDQVTPIRTINGVGLSAGFPKVNWRLPSYGKIRALIVPVDFPDVNGVDNAPAFFTPIANNVRDFYFNQSYGRLTFDFEILPNWVRVPFSVSDFGYGSTVGSGDPGSYLKAIVKLADPLIDLGQYDAVYFLVPKQMPFEKMGWGPAITHPSWTRTGYFTNGATGGADMYLPQNGTGADWKWMVHETGHAFGLYDEDLDHASASLGSWGVMADSWTNNVIEHNAWDRYLQGWLTEMQTSCIPRNQLSASGTTVKLNPLVRQNSEIKVAMVPLSDSKILVMESRKNEGFDHIEASKEGVLVYTVDMKLGHLKGGYQTQRRIGSTDRLFEDASLKTGDTITVDGITITVLARTSDTDTIKISIK